MVVISKSNIGLEVLDFGMHRDEFEPVAENLQQLRDEHGQRKIGAEFWVKPSLSRVAAKFELNRLTDGQGLRDMARAGLLYVRRKK